MVDVYGKLVGKYTFRPMDPSWVCCIFSNRQTFRRKSKVGEASPRLEKSMK